MKVTTYGVILALKNLGVWLSQYTIAGITVDKPSFMFAMLIYILVSVPSDLLLLNHVSNQAQAKSQAEAESQPVEG